MEINFGTQIKNIIYWLSETQYFNIQILKDMDDDEWMYLPAANY